MSNVSRVHDFIPPPVHRSQMDAFYVAQTINITFLNFLGRTKTPNSIMAAPWFKFIQLHVDMLLLLKISPPSNSTAQQRHKGLVYFIN